MKRNFFIFYILLTSCWTFAQPQNEHTKIPEGKWVLEDMVAFEKNVQVPFTVENLGCCQVPVEIEVQLDELTFVCKERTDKVEYNAVVRENIICFPICAEWKIVNNKLFLQWVQDVDTDPEALSITLIFSKK